MYSIMYTCFYFKHIYAVYALYMYVFCSQSCSFQQLKRQGTPRTHRKARPTEGPKTPTKIPAQPWQSGKFNQSMYQTVNVGKYTIQKSYRFVNTPKYCNYCFSLNVYHLYFWNFLGPAKTLVHSF